MYQQMMKELQEDLIETTTVVFDDGTEWILDFYLQFVDDTANLYGVKINRRTMDGVLIESDETFAATENRDDAIAMIKAFAKGKVLPMSLLYMVDDWEPTNLWLPT